MTMEVQPASARLFFLVISSTRSFVCFVLVCLANNSFSKTFISVCASTRAHAHMYISVSAVPTEQKKAFDPWNRSCGVCELPDTGAGNLTWCSYFTRVLLTAQPCLRS